MDFFTPKFIYNTFYVSILLFNFIIIAKLVVGNISKRDSKFLLVFSVFLIILLGLRPLQGKGVGQYFGDTVNYYNSFFNKHNGSINNANNDYGFALFTKFFYSYLNVKLYFFTLVVLYILPLYFAIKRLNVNYKILIFLMMLSSFLFYSNGVNGIRSGIGSSFVLLGMTYNKREIKYSLFYFLIAVGFHKSMLLPASAFLFTYYIKNTYLLIIWWIISIVLSYTIGESFTSFFSIFDKIDHRFSEYFNKKYDFQDAFRYSGFRWDFILYSASAVYMGYIILIKKHLKDLFYSHLFNTYLLANSFWIIVIRSNFSNRFASLSWFLIPILLIYPLIKYNFFKKQKFIILVILLANIIFTFIMK